MPEHRTQFAFKDKRERIAKVNITDMAYPSEYINIEIPHGSRDHVMQPDTVKIFSNVIHF